jgi:hypothetical protein
MAGVEQRLTAHRTVEKPEAPFGACRRLVVPYHGATQALPSVREAEDAKG